MKPGVSAERLAAGAAEAALAAGVHQVRHHAVARLPALDALADLGDPADDLDAEDERELDREARDALADVDVEVVESAGADVDQDLAGAGPRIVDSSSRRTSSRRTRGTPPPSRDLRAGTDGPVYV